MKIRNDPEDHAHAVSGGAGPDSPPIGEPQRVQLSRVRGWRMPPNTVKVDRSTRWGNPFWVQRVSGEQWNFETLAWEAMWEVCQPGAYRGQTFNSKTGAAQFAVLRFVCEITPLLDLSDLRGKNLACWCALDQPCHADMLLKMANADGVGGAPRPPQTPDAVPGTST